MAKNFGHVLKKTGSFYYHCDWHASHYVKALLDQILQLSPAVKKFAELEGLGAHGKSAEVRTTQYFDVKK
jgi:histidinol dehydrogenase